MALTATATKTTRKFIIDSLSMQLPGIIYIPPVKNNIIYMVLDKPKDIGDYFEQIVEKLKVEGISMHRMIIFCKSYNIITIYSYFKQKLGERMTELPGSPNFVINRLVDIYSLYTRDCKEQDYFTIYKTISTSYCHCYHRIWHGNRLSRCTPCNSLGCAYRC